MLFFLSNIYIYISALQKALLKFLKIASNSTANYNTTNSIASIRVDEAELELLDKYLLPVYDNESLPMIILNLQVLYRDGRNNERSKSLESIQDLHNAKNMGSARNMARAKKMGSASDITRDLNNASSIVNNSLSNFAQQSDEYTSNIASFSGDSNDSTYGYLKQFSFSVADPENFKTLDQTSGLGNGVGGCTSTGVQCKLCPSLSPNGQPECLKGQGNLAAGCCT